MEMARALRQRDAVIGTIGDHRDMTLPSPSVSIVHEHRETVNHLPTCSLDMDVGPAPIEARSLLRPWSSIVRR